MNAPPLSATRRISNGRIAAIRETVSLLEVASPRVAWDAKRSSPSRGDYWAPCPFHAERTPSFHVDERKNRFKCFGCGASGDVIAFFQLAEHCSFLEAVEALAVGRLITPLSDADRRRRQTDRLRAEERVRIERVRVARTLWQQAHPLAPADRAQWRYLTEVRRVPRALIEKTNATGTLRAGSFGLADARVQYPALFALMQDNQTALPRAVSLTLLALDGSGKAPVDRPRLTYGPAKGASVRLLQDTTRTLAIAEGLETAMSFAALYGVCCWTAAGAANLAQFTPPAEITRVIVAADSDEAGLAAARRLAQRSTAQCLVDVVAAPASLDWNDVLRGASRNQA